MNASVLQDRWTDAVRAVEQSALFRNLVVASAVLFILLCILLVMVGITFTLRQFFKHHPVITRAHKVLIYLLTMSGVLALLFAGILGLFLPIIPGVVFILAGLLLMRRYHRWVWLDTKIGALRTMLHRARLRHRRRRAMRQRKIQEKVNKSTERQHRRSR